MLRPLFLIALIAGFAAMLVPANAQELSGPCPIGAQVTDGQSKTGTVLDTDPVGCHVGFPDGTKSYYLSWMLHLAGTPTVAPTELASVAPGHYACWAGREYISVDINITDAGNYTDVQGTPGTYSYDPTTQLITFSSGTLVGSFAKYLGKQGIGLASTPTDFFETVCDIES